MLQLFSASVRLISIAPSESVLPLPSLQQEYIPIYIRKYLHKNSYISESRECTGNGRVWVYRGSHDDDYFLPCRWNLQGVVRNQRVPCRRYVTIHHTNRIGSSFDHHRNSFHAPIYSIDNFQWVSATVREKKRRGKQVKTWYLSVLPTVTVFC